LVVQPNNGVDKIVAALSVRGQPATIEQLLGDLDEDYSARSIRNRVTDDPRIIRVNRTDFGLRSWNLEEYSGIAVEITERIERAGGSAQLDQVVAELVSSFGVKAISVRSYAQAPMFVVENGFIRLREPHEQFQVHMDIRLAKGVFKIEERCLAIFLEIDENLLRGSGQPIPHGIGGILALEPGSKTTYTSQFGEVVLSWPMTGWNGPSLGSVRNCAQGLGGALGDHLRLIFDSRSLTVASHIVRPRALAEAAPETVLREFTGLNIGNARDAEHALATAIGCPVGLVRSLLQERGDHLVLEALPPLEINSDLANEVDELVRLLGHNG
jgi:hypothetical protein